MTEVRVLTLDLVPEFGSVLCQRWLVQTLQVTDCLCLSSRPTNTLPTHPRSTMVSGLKPGSSKGRSTGLLVQTNVFCLGTRALGAIWELPDFQLCGQGPARPTVLADCGTPGAAGGSRAARSSEGSGLHTTSRGLPKRHRDTVVSKPGSNQIPPTRQTCHRAPGPEAQLSSAAHPEPGQSFHGNLCFPESSSELIMFFYLSSWKVFFCKKISEQRSLRN